MSALACMFPRVGFAHSLLHDNMHASKSTKEGHKRPPCSPFKGVTPMLVPVAFAELWVFMLVLGGHESSFSIADT